MVQTPYHYYRRNRRNLIPLANQETASSVDNPIPTPIEIPDETFITISDENPSVVQTRSGRISRPLYGLLRVNNDKHFVACIILKEGDVVDTLGFYGNYVIGVM